MVSSTLETQLIECGRIGRAIGLKGDVVVTWNSGACPVDIGGEIVIAAKDGEGTRRSIRVAALRKQGRSSVVRFEGVADRTAAQALRDAALFIPADRLAPLPQGEYYSYQILGCEVVTEEGRHLGRVVRIFPAGGTDVYEVRPKGEGQAREILIPATDEVILSVDTAARQIVIRPLEGMLDSCGSQK